MQKNVIAKAGETCGSRTALFTFLLHLKFFLPFAPQNYDAGSGTDN